MNDCFKTSVILTATDLVVTYEQSLLSSAAWTHLALDGDLLSYPDQEHQITFSNGRCSWVCEIKYIYSLWRLFSQKWLSRTDSQRQMLTFHTESISTGRAHLSLDYVSSISTGHISVTQQTVAESSERWRVLWDTGTLVWFTSERNCLLYMCAIMTWVAFVVPLLLLMISL